MNRPETRAVEDFTPATSAGELSHREILDSALDAVIGIDARGCVLEWNRQAEAVFGWSRDEVLGQPLAELVIPPNYRRTHKRGLERFLSTGESDLLNRRLELTALRRDGGEFPVELSVTVARLDGGEPVFHAFIRDITERKQSEAAAARLAALVESTDDAVIGATPDGTIQTWNRGAELMYGYTADEAIGQPVSFLLPPHHRDEFADVLLHIVRGQSVRNFESVHVRKQGGGSVQVSLTVSPVRDGDQRVSGVALIARDVTSRKEIEALLARQAQEARVLHFATELAAETDSFEKAVQGCVHLVCEMTGWPVGHVYVPSDDGGKLVPTSIWYLDAPEADADFREITERTHFAAGEGLPGRIWSTGEPVWIPNLHQADDFARAGHEHDVRLKGAFGFPIKVRGETVAVLEFFTDEEIAPDARLLVTLRSVGEQVGRVIERRRAEEALRQSEERLRFTLEAARVGTWDWNILTSEVNWSSNMDALHGQPPGSFGGTFESFLEDVHPDDRERVKQGIARAIEQGGDYHVEYRLNRAEDPPDWVEGKGRVVYDESGRAVRMAGVCMDLTERKRFEQELHQAKDAAEAANRAKGEFLANVSHELRTPMNAIIGMTELALDDELSAAVREYLETVRESAGHLLRLLNELLDFSKLESGKFALEPAPFRLREELDETLKTLSVPAHEKKLELTCEVAPDVPDRLVGDPVRLRQVMTNLVGNAIKFTEQGEVSIQVELAEPAGDDAQLHVVVSDTGPGIAPQDQRRVFAPFTQVDSSNTRVFAGTGLGLAIASELVSLMGGRIWLASELDRGSRFHFTARFPVQGTEAAPSEGRPERPLPAERPRRPLRILLAEDTPANQKLVTSILKKRGHRVEVADNGRAVLELLGQGEFDLVLMDVQMPAMDGFQATAAIRALDDPQRRRVPIVAMTAHAMSGDRERCLQAGMDAYVAKPIDMRELLDLVERLGLAADEPAAPSRPPRNSAVPRSSNGDPAGEVRDGPVFDLDASLARVGGDRELLQAMVGFFFDDIPSLLDEMRDGLRERDPDVVRRAAHSLRGLAASFSARQTVTAAGELEQLGASGDLQALPHGVERLRHELTRLQQALEPLHAAEPPNP